MIRVNHQLGFVIARTLVAMNREVAGLLPDDVPAGHHPSGRDGV
ncbi:hypothetical protein ABZ816_34150 [Actinosynnema sp. NPDC047251]|nr:hypothetical protein [Saccharothrix espanaensis]